MARRQLKISTTPPAPNTFNDELRRAIRGEDLEKIDFEEWEGLVRGGEIEELEVLGEGNGGCVRKARRRGGELIFALKTIPADPNPRVHKQILRELAINRGCQSEHIVKYYGAVLNESSATISIFMEYCQGGSLDGLYKRLNEIGGRVNENVLGKIAYGVLAGLVYLHDQKVIHRDIKPSNILLTVSGEIKLCDFGVSGELVNSLAGTFTGTSAYMAPERIQGQSYSVKADVWSLGLTLMEVAQNAFPFEDSKKSQVLIELLMAIVTMPVPELQDEVGIVWTGAFKHFLHVCLEKDPEKRPGPSVMLEHPWIKGHMKKKVNMARFIQSCWGLDEKVGG